MQVLVSFITVAGGTVSGFVYLWHKEQHELGCVKISCCRLCGRGPSSSAHRTALLSTPLWVCKRKVERGKGTHCGSVCRYIWESLQVQKQEEMIPGGGFV